MIKSIACNAVDTNGFSIGHYILGSGAIGERSGVSSPFSLDISQSSKNFKGTSAGATVQFGGVMGNEAVKVPTNPNDPFSSCDQSNLATCSSINTGMKVMAAQISALAANCGYNPKNPQAVMIYLIRLIMSLFTAVALIYVFSTMLQFIPYL